MTHRGGNRTSTPSLRLPLLSLLLILRLLLLLLLLAAFDAAARLRYSRRSRCLLSSRTPLSLSLSPSFAPPCTHAHTLSFSLSLSSVLLTPLLSSFDAVNPCRDVLFSRFSIAHWLASVDSRDCVMHMQLHLASEYANPIITVKLDRHRLSIADRPNETRVFLTLPPAALLSLPTWHLAKKSRLCAYDL